jgi:hypothetical protein
VINAKNKPLVIKDEQEPCLQRVLDELETYKRRVGRHFDRATEYQTRVWNFNKYNMLENLIREMVDLYGLTRRYQPHKLKLENL